jgi:hypothetical protein
MRFFSGSLISFLQMKKHYTTSQHIASYRTKELVFLHEETPEKHASENARYLSFLVEHTEDHYVPDVLG